MRQMQKVKIIHELTKKIILMRLEKSFIENGKVVLFSLSLCLALYYFH